MNKKFKRFAVLTAAAVMSVSMFTMFGCTDGKEDDKKDPPPIIQEKTVSKIAVTTRPRLKYLVGEMFDKTGMVVTATYSDGTTAEVTDYTVDKTAPLTVKDVNVTVMYKGKMAFLPLTVNIKLDEKLTIPNAENAVYTVEAEALDYFYCENSNLAGELPKMEYSNNSSGGCSMGALSVGGNMFGFKVNCAEEVTVDFYVRASAVSVDMACDDVMSLFVNDVQRHSEYTLTWGGDGAWWDWEHVPYKNITLNQGENEIYIKINNNRAPNFDCFYLVASPTGNEELGPGQFIPPAPEYRQMLEITSTENAVYKVEAEDLDYSTCKNSNRPELNPNIEAPITETSGGASVGSLGVVGNKFGFTVKSEVEGKAKISMLVSSGNRNTQDLDQVLKITWNDVEYRTGHVVSEVKKDADGKDIWHVWELAEITAELDIVKGDNLFVIEVIANSAPNFDCFILEVNPDNTEIPVPPVPLEYEKKLDITSADNALYKVEAENLSLSLCTHSSGEGRPNFENPSTVTSGGLCVSSLGYRGNKLGFTVESTVEANANLILRVSAGTVENQNLDKLLLLTWNGVEYITGYTAPNPLTEGVGWHKWEDAIMYNLPLVKGYNTFVLEVVGNGCPNIDCFILEVNPDNTGVEIPEKYEYDKKLDILSAENAVYKVEAESLDYSGCKNSNNHELNPKVEYPATETSGGASVGALGVAGNKFGYTVKSEVEGKVKISMLVSSGNRNAQNLDQILKITWNGVEYKTGHIVSEVKKDAGGKDLWNVWEVAEITAELDLVKGNNVFVIEVIANSAPNIDCFILEVNPEKYEYAKKLDITSAENKRYTVEAESLDYSECKNSNNHEINPKIEYPATETSGGASVGALGVAGNKFGFTVKSEVEGKVKISMLVSSGNRNAQDLDQILKITWNGVEYKTGHIVSEVKKDATGKDMWNVWELAEITVELDLVKGKNVFVVEVIANSAPNIDCFILEVNPEKYEYAKKLDITSAENKRYKVEAESLDFSGCKNSNNPDINPNVEYPATQTSGGASVGGLGVAGNKFGFTVKSDVEGKVKISMLVSSGNRNAQDLDRILKITWNGVEYKTGHIVSEVKKDANGNDVWHAWEAAEIVVELDLVKGNNVFVIEIVDNSAPNIDCFILEVNPENGENNGGNTAE